MKRKTALNVKKRVLAGIAISALALATVAGAVNFGLNARAATGSDSSKAEYGELLGDQPLANLSLRGQAVNTTTVLGSSWDWLPGEKNKYFGDVGKHRFVVTKNGGEAYDEVEVDVQPKTLTPGFKFGKNSGTLANFVSGGFASINEYKRTVSVYSSGSGHVSGDGSYVIGQSTPLTATPDSGYHFVKWDDGNTSASRTVTVKNSSNSYTATFEKNAPATATITVSSNNPDYGTVSGGGTFNVGATTTITATPKTNYKFVRWNDSNTSATRTVTVTSGGSTYMAIFERETATITVSSNNPSYGTVSGGGTYDVGSSVTITATPKTNCHFVQWSDGNTSASRSVTVKSGTNSYTATFAKDTATVTVSSNNTSYGTVSGGGTYDVGSSVTITASPKTGYKFVQWNDGNTIASRSITVTSGTNSYTATFAADAVTGRVTYAAALPKEVGSVNVMTLKNACNVLNYDVSSSCYYYAPGTDNNMHASDAKYYVYICSDKDQATNFTYLRDMNIEEYSKMRKATSFTDYWSVSVNGSTVYITGGPLYRLTATTGGDGTKIGEVEWFYGNGNSYTWSSESSYWNAYKDVEKYYVAIMRVKA